MKIEIIWISNFKTLHMVPKQTRADNPKVNNMVTNPLMSNPKDPKDLTIDKIKKIRVGHRIPKPTLLMRIIGTTLRIVMTIS